MYIRLGGCFLFAKNYFLKVGHTRNYKIFRFIPSSNYEKTIPSSKCIKIRRNFHRNSINFL